MYSWGDSMDDWARPGAYRFDEARAAARRRDAGRAKKAGRRSYHDRNEPIRELTDPSRRIGTRSSTPLLVGIDVTGSMQQWPFEIFDRLPLLYQTLSQYRPELEIAFFAIGDAGCDRFPLQATDFANGYDLEQRLKALYGEGGGGDEPESYGLFAWYVQHMVDLPDLSEPPFLLVFGDASMHPTVPARQIKAVTGTRVNRAADSLALWQALTRRFNVWFLRRPTGHRGDHVEEQWASAVGRQRIVHLHDELRAVDYAMGLVARQWGRFDDFRDNLAARQEDAVVETVENSLLSVSLDTVPPTRRSSDG